MSLLRSSRLALVALSGLLMAGTTGVALAQPLAMMAAAQGGGGGGRRGGVTLDALTTRLKLTPDQQEKIKPILADRDTQMTALRGDQSASQDDRRAKMMKIRTDTNDKINAVLTPDQQALDQRLRDWRKTESEKLNLPLFFVLSSSTLRNIVLARPQNLTQLKSVHGLGLDKIEKFGPGIIQVCTT